jgi:hypothetical protein
LLEGDSNTKYFQLLANGRHQKSRIYQVQDGSHNISGDTELKKYITSYYKGMFGPPGRIQLGWMIVGEMIFPK